MSSQRRLRRKIVNDCKLIAAWSCSHARLLIGGGDANVGPRVLWAFTRPDRPWTVLRPSYLVDIQGFRVGFRLTLFWTPRQPSCLWTHPHPALPQFSAKTPANACLRQGGAHRRGTEPVQIVGAGANVWNGILHAPRRPSKSAPKCRLWCCQTRSRADLHFDLVR